MNMRQRLQRMLEATAGVLVAPLALPAVLGIRCGSASAFIGGGHLLGLIPGRIGQYARAGYYASTLRSCGPGVVLEFMASISSPQAVVGPRVVVGSYGAIGMVDIGPDVVIGDRAMVGNEHELIHLGAGCAIGEGAVILADVGAGACIAPGAVVTKAVPKGATGSGHPLCIT